MEPSDAVIYHIYALGTFGALDAPRDVPGTALRDARAWVPLIEAVGANVLLLGPLFESERHGYDSVDLSRVDRRLGTEEDLAELSRHLRDRGITLMLDAVLNHVGRSHPIVREAASIGESAERARWIAGFDPKKRRGGLPFSYEAWKGHDDLVRLDTSLPEVQAWLLDAVSGWVDRFGIGGLRLDAADCLDRSFVRALSERHPDLLLLGEAVHGDQYARLLDSLDSVTNYEAYKSLWSSHNDGNFHELSWTLERLFGSEGLCRGRLLQSFADNHDVNRIASTLRDPAHLYTLYGILFSMPGIPSIYCGSEYGLEGRRTRSSDLPLRPRLDPDVLPSAAPHPDLAAALARFAKARGASRAVREGTCEILRVEMRQIAYLRELPDDLAIIVVNSDHQAAQIKLSRPSLAGRELVDLLGGEPVRFDREGQATIAAPPCWLRWLVAGAT